LFIISVDMDKECCEQLFSVGTEVYYAGDSANDPGFGVITRCHESDSLQEFRFDVEMQDGGIFHSITPYDFRTFTGSTEASARFVLKAELEGLPMKKGQSVTAQQAKARIRAILRR
jgi:hypothetical protein